MFWFHITEAIKIFRRASLASIIAIITSTIAVTLITLSVLFIFLSDTFNEKLKNQIEINVFLKKDIPATNLDSLRIDLKENKIVGYAKYISEQDAVERFIAQTGEDFRSVLNLNPLPSSFVIRLKSEHVTKTNLLKTIDRYTSFPGVDEVKCDFETALSILRFIDNGKFILYSLTAILVLISLYFVYSTHRMWVLSRQTQFNTMKLVGAKISTIKTPIIINGMIIGIIAGSVCTMFFFFISNFLESVYGLKIFENYKYLLFSSIFIGAGLGFLSSLLSTKSITLKIDQR